MKQLTAMIAKPAGVVAGGLCGDPGDADAARQQLLHHWRGAPAHSWCDATGDHVVSGGDAGQLSLEAGRPGAVDLGCLNRDCLLSRRAGVQALVLNMT